MENVPRYLQTLFRTACRSDFFSPLRAQPPRSKKGQATS